MDYKFKCPKCGEKYILSIPVTDYSFAGHICQNPNCDGELERDIEDFAGGFIWKCTGAYGKSS